MKALIWKDFMAGRTIWIGGLILMLIPYLLVAAIAAFEDRPAPLNWWRVIGHAWQGSAVISMLVVAMVGGCAFSVERADRSAEFLTYLPPSRRAIVTSKAIVAIAVIIVVIVFNMLVLSAIENKSIVDRDDLQELCDILWSTALLIFGFSWFPSSFLKSPAISTSLGIVMVVIFWIIFSYSYRWAPSDPIEFYIPIAIILGIGAFVGGILCYLHRAEP